MNVCYYCRVAYDDGCSLAMQKVELRRYAEQIGTIVGEYAEHSSGLTLARPELQRVTEALLSGQAEMLIVKSIDRISRAWNMTQRYIELLTRHGIRLLCIKDQCMFSDKGVFAF